MKTKLKIILVDDHELFRMGAVSLIKHQGDYEVIASLSSGEELLSQLLKLGGDLLILDLAMPKMNGIEVLKEIRKRNNSLKVIVLSAYSDLEFVKAAHKYQVTGYVIKSDPPSQLLEAIQKVAGGGKFYSTSISSKATEVYLTAATYKDDYLSVLTGKELEILKLIGEGLSNKELALKKTLSVRTVETYKRNIQRKLGLHTTAGLISFAYKAGMVN